MAMTLAHIAFQMAMYISSSCETGKPFRKENPLRNQFICIVMFLSPIKRHLCVELGSMFCMRNGTQRYDYNNEFEYTGLT